MRSFWQIFLLEFRAFRRSHALAFLIVATLVWMLVLPCFLAGDGTSEGARELYVHYSLGGVFALVVIALLGSATGSIARERETRRLQLALVRPVSRFAYISAKSVALTFIGAVVLAVASFVLYFTAGRDADPCNHVLSPVLPSPREEAKVMYAAYMASPDTPIAVKRTKKEIVLRLLENRAIDRYETIPTNGVKRWKFDLSSFNDGLSYSLPDKIAARFHFSGAFNRREVAVGALRLGAHCGSISNLTQSSLVVPLYKTLPSAAEMSSELEFINCGDAALQFRPRRDVQLLMVADGFGWNLLRAYLELMAMVALLIAFGLTLSASLGRPVAVFVAFIVLLLSEVSPSVIESYPDELEEKLADRIGLVLTRAAAEVTKPISSLNPIEKLATDDCVESKEVLRVVLLDGLVVPLILFSVAAFILPRKQEE